MLRKKEAEIKSSSNGSCYKPQDSKDDGGIIQHDQDG